mgnify:CR=1 FL=1
MKSKTKKIYAKFESKRPEGDYDKIDENTI